MRLSTPHDFTLPVERSNYQHLVLDIAFFGLALAATSRFLSVYAIRLGATPLQLGLISSLPPIVLLFSAALGNWWLRRNPDTVRAIYYPGFYFRLLFLLPAFAPFLPAAWQPLWLILSVTLPAIPQGIASVCFLVMQREAIHTHHITLLTSHRMLALNTCVGAAALLFGVWLETAPFPLNYQTMFLLAFAFALLSQRQLTRITRFIPQPPRESDAKVVSPWRSSQFKRVIFATGIAHIAFTSIIAITPLRLVSDLNASEGFMALFGLAELIAGATMALFTDRIARRIGNQAMIALSMIGTALAALILALAPNLPLTLVGATLSGAGWTAAAIGMFSLFNEHSPSEGMTRYSIAYQQIIGLAMFVGPMIGSLLVQSGAKVVLVILVGAGLRLLAGALTEHGVFLKVGRFSALRAGMALKAAKLP